MTSKATEVCVAEYCLLWEHPFWHTLCYILQIGTRLDDVENNKYITETFEQPLLFFKT